MNNLNMLERRIGMHFRDPLLLQQAVTHCSFLNENRNHKLQHNERLEFLGDAVLEMVVTDELFRRYPDKGEGRLTEIRSYLVNGANEAKIAQKLGLDEFMLLSKGERRDQRSRPAILANALEAVIGAIYLDQGMPLAKRFVESFFLASLPGDIDKIEIRDSKSLLQELSQGRVGYTPRYEILNEIGADHDKTFTVGVYVGKTLLAQGQGTSRARAEMNAAELALEKAHA